MSGSEVENEVGESEKAIPKEKKRRRRKLKKVDKLKVYISGKRIHFLNSTF